MPSITNSIRFGDEILSELRDLKSRNASNQAKSEEENLPKTSFMEHLKNAVEEVNQNQIATDKKATDLANGKETNIHDTMLAAAQAELSFNLMVQVRNKALEAYHEVMRMPV